MPTETKKRTRKKGLPDGSDPDFGTGPGAWASRCPEIWRKVLDTFQDEEKAVRWMTKPNRSLNDQRPADLIGTARGTRQVEEVLDRIAYGIYG